MVSNGAATGHLRAITRESCPGPQAAERVANFADADNFISNVCRADEFYLPLGAGEFHASFGSFRLGRIVVQAAEECRARVARIAVDPGWTRISFHVGGELGSVCAGEDFSYGQVVLHGPGNRHHHRTRGPIKWCSIMMPSSLMVEVLGSPSMIPAQEEQSFFTPGRERLRRLIRWYCDLLDQRGRASGASGREDGGSALEPQILERLASGLRPGAASAGSAAHHRAQSVVNRLEAVLTEEDLETPNCMSDVADRLSVAERTLRSCCRRILGMSPGRYIRARRLYMARRSLTTSDPASTSVTEIALQHGFFEFGRFAGVYRAEFGESPSATLRRARVVPAFGPVLA